MNQYGKCSGYFNTCLQYPTIVICPIQLYDRWNLPRLLLDAEPTEQALDLAGHFVDTLLEIEDSWLSDKYIETLSRDEAGPEFENWILNITEGETLPCLSRFIVQELESGIYLR